MCSTHSRVRHRWEETCFFQVIACYSYIGRTGSRFQSADGILRAPPELLRAAGEPRDDAAAPAPRPAPGGEPVEERGHAARLALRVRLSQPRLDLAVALLRAKLAFLEICLPKLNMILFSNF